MFRLFVILLILGFAKCNSDITNTKVERTIDIASQLVKITTKISLQNTGKAPVSAFLYVIEPEIRPNLAFMGASHSTEVGKSFLKIQESTQGNLKVKDLYKILFTTPLSPGKKIDVEVETVFTHYLVPHPSQITQSEKQMVLYHGNHYFFSPYETLSQKTNIVLPSNSVESYSKNLKPVSHTDNTITYGPYEKISPLSENKLIVHCENNNVFLTVSKLYRAIEVSHWGIISIEEVLDVVHTGATLKGSFSRYEFQRDQSGISSVKSFKTVLPASASDVYYRDEIGNISTSHLKELDDSVEVELRPRFPLFGGWKTHYVLGYYVPTYEYLFNTGNQYVLKVRFVDHIFDDSIIDDATVKVILPEGSKNIKVKLPFAAARLPNELHFTYLDTIGRPVVLLNKQNLVEQHIQDFEVHYEYQKLLMLQEPLLVVVALYLLFVLVIFYVRLDFTLTKDSSIEGKLRVSSYVDQVQSHHDKRTDIYGGYDEAMNKFKHSKDHTTYQATIKKLNSDYKTETQFIADILSKLKLEGSETAEKVADLQRLDKILKDLLQQQMVLVEKLISNKMNKQQYLDAETAINKKKEDAVEKMQSAVSAL